MFGVSFTTQHGDMITISRHLSDSDNEATTPILNFLLDVKSSNNIAQLTRAEVVDLQATIDVVLGNSPAQW